MDTETFPQWRTDWREFEQWLDGLDFSNSNAHVAEIATAGGRYVVTVSPKILDGKPFRPDSEVAE